MSSIQKSGQSSQPSTLQNQINYLGPRNDHCSHSSSHKEPNHVENVPNIVESNCNVVCGSTGNLISDDDTFNRGPNLSTGHEDGVISCHSIGVPGNSGQQEDISSGSNASISGLSDKREVKVGLRQVVEVGSSSSPQQADNSLSNNISVHLNAPSTHTLLTSPSSLSHENSQEYPMLRSRVGLHENSNSHHHPSTSIHPERPQGNFNLGQYMQSQRNSVLATRNSPIQFVHNGGPSSLPMGIGDVFEGSNTPNMSRTDFVPSGSRIQPQSPLAINSSSRASTSNERRLFPDVGDFVHHPQHHSLADGRYAALDVASNHQMEHNAGYYHWPSLLWVHPLFNQAGSQQMALGYSPWFPSPCNGLGSSAQNVDVAPLQYPATYGYVMSADMMLESGHNLGQDAHFSGPFISQSRHRLFPRSLQSMEAPIRRDHGTMPELYQIDSNHVADFQAQAMARSFYNRRGYPHMRDRHRDMRLDVDQMSYEELLTLGEQIGSVKTGLEEETIMKLLKRREYECVINDPSSDAETCCICIQEYVREEDIGVLNCGHEFHTACIKKWLKIKNKCPICMKEGLGA
ncbi:hypothetical protein BVRB_9g216200 isoform A [Beta vulgaris subsp. vulgaris]|nr:hypothetical protein BVRB_9g216200 isoform A [Beta vulgaris subsp. vulgaris]